MRSALVLGGAECVWRDIDAAHALFKPDLIVAINDMIACWPHRIDIAVTLHPEKLERPGRKYPGDGDWLRRRVESGYEKPSRIIAHIACDHGKTFPVDKTTSDWTGSSSLFAVKVLREEGIERIVLAGCPMVIEAGHFIRKEPWTSVTTFRSKWVKHKDEIAPYVRSLSGWTQKTFGSPTAAWLHATA